jgi:peptidyl-tRNA hydrolase, PTH2 family
MGFYDVKQVIVIRRDLKCRRGKEIAQGSHASMAFLTAKIRSQGYFKRLWMSLLGRDILSPIEREWVDGSFAKVVCQCNSEQELMDIAKKAMNAGLEYRIITDAGKTEFGGVPTVTALAIGPDRADKIDAITGNLSLY